MGRKLLIAAVVVCAATAPALAYSQAPSSGSFKAYDDGWTATPGGGTTLTITKPGTVEFGYPSGQSSHTLTWTSADKPRCTGVPTGLDYPGGVPGWNGTCSFPDTGTFTFRCGIHDYMTGSVKVQAPAPSPSPSPSPSPTPSASATPDATPTTPGATPTPSGPAQNQPPTTQPSAKPLAAKLPAAQKGTRVRGTVTIAQPASRLEISVTLKNKRVGHYLKAAAGSGTRAFAVPLNARGRRELKRRHSLKLRVVVVVAGQQKTFSVRLRR